MLYEESVVISIFFYEDLFYFQQQHTLVVSSAISQIVSQNFQMGTSPFNNVLYVKIRFIKK